MSSKLVTVIGPMFGLVMVMVSVDTPPEAIGLALKALLIVGAAAVTVRLAVFETAPVGASTLVTPVVALGKVPGVLLRTTMETVHEPLAGMVRPVKLSKPVWLTVKLLLPAPVQVPVAAPVAWINMLVRVSLNPAPVSAIPLVLLMVKSI